MIPEKYRAQVERMGLTPEKMRVEFGIEPKNEAQWDILMNARMQFYPNPLPKPYTAEETDLFSEGLMTIAEAAKHLSLNRATIYRAMERGELVFCKMGKSRRIPRKALRIWTEAY
jgi:excisionase family DNA binding protein